MGQEQSKSSGWDRGDGSGETIGHESGRKIIEISNKNPRKYPLGYAEDDLPHMRKVRVVSYCKRHLAQEEKAKQDTNSKSDKSLKNCTSTSKPFFLHSISELESQDMYGSRELCTLIHLVHLRFSYDGKLLILNLCRGHNAQK